MYFKTQAKMIVSRKLQSNPFLPMLCQMYLDPHQKQILEDPGTAKNQLLQG